MLEIDELHAYYGKSHVLHGVSLQVRAGEIVSLLGRNGSGRSTTVKAVMGLVEARGAVPRRWRCSPSSRFWCTVSDGKTSRPSGT